MHISIHVPGPPVGKGRTRPTKTGHFILPEKTINYQNLVKMQSMLAMAGEKPTPDAVWMEVMALYPIPASKPKKVKAAMLAGEIRPTCKPDADNVLKALMDGMNEVVFVDDKQVSDLHISRRYSDAPGVEIKVGTYP